jgi:hypothetical protein
MRIRNPGTNFIKDFPIRKNIVHSIAANNAIPNFLQNKLYQGSTLPESALQRAVQ